MTDWAADIETDGLLDRATTMHVCVFADIYDTSARYVMTTIEDLKQFVENNIREGDNIWWHNVFGFDLPVLEKLYNINVE